MEHKLDTLCDNHPQISSLFRCVGSWDYKLFCIAQNEGDILDILEDLKVTCHQNFTSEFLVKGHKGLAVNSRPLADFVI